ncbi:MAG TPA: sulfate ABC transporter substrate-binding protein [Steroidobacteraceae bacterium]|nr:sulfate ABC transporter substrate-binding protein [Steroidobacteraceae bacterium]
MKRSLLCGVLCTVVAAVCVGPTRAAQKTTLVNVSYDVSRELFAQINPAFAAAWRERTGQDIEIRQSHGGSSAQARSVAEGLQADVVTLNQETDVEFLVKSGLVAADWAKKLPENASPYYSFPVFLVRAGNPQHIKDWDDLARPGVQPIFPNPKTSGNGRYTYLAAYSYALSHDGGDKAKARTFLAALLANVPVFDTGGRGATTTFVERRIGDVLITFESEVNSIRRQYTKVPLQAVYPSTSVRADFPVAVVDKVVDRRGTRAAATAYLEFLYGDAGQEILAENFYRVRSAAVAARDHANFPDIKLTSVDELGGWQAISATHFAEGGLLDQLLAAKR